MGLGNKKKNLVNLDGLWRERILTFLFLITFFLSFGGKYIFLVVKRLKKF